MSIDLHFQLIDPTNQRRKAVFTFGFANPIYVSGPQALVNRWLKVFMTPKGTHPWRHDEGTEFPALIGANFSTFDQLQVDVLDAIEDATAQVKAQDQKVPARRGNERLLSASLLRFVEVSPTEAEFWVEIQNVAGERINVLIPYAPG
jgi:hypothetical protein